MKFKAKRQVIVEEEIDVDDRIYREDDIAWQIANIILNRSLNSITDDLYSERMDVVKSAAERINDAFRKADGCIQAVHEGKFEV